MLVEQSDCLNKAVDCLENEVKAKEEVLVTKTNTQETI